MFECSPDWIPLFEVAVPVLMFLTALIAAYKLFDE